MKEKKFLEVSNLLKQLEDYKLVTNDQTLNKKIHTLELYRPGLSLISNENNYDYDNVQICGNAEVNFLKKQSNIQLEMLPILNKIIPLIIFTNDYMPSQEFIDIANKENIPILISKKNSTACISQIYHLLRYELAPTLSYHGVLLNILGLGVIIKGKSGIGKSEVALELVKSGFSLVADDLIEIRQVDKDLLMGRAPELLSNRIEIRGIGIINIQKLYGIVSVLSENKIDLVIELTDPSHSEDRIGNKILFEKIINVEIDKVSLPVYTGRSLSSLIEIAVANYKMKKYYNYDASKEFINDLNELINAKKK